MTLLFVMNLGFAWGANTAPAAPEGSKTVAQPKAAGSMKTRS
jgi:hypothetical protein